MVVNIQYNLILQLLFLCVYSSLVRKNPILRDVCVLSTHTSLKIGKFHLMLSSYGFVNFLFFNNLI